MHPAERLRELETRARRRFGQNFLVAAGIAEMIVTRAGVRAGERVLEIGPGLGVLTGALQRAGATVVAIELDRDLAAALPEVAPAVELIVGDAMRVALPAVDRVVANLPYNVASPLCLRLLDLGVPMALMFQREVADRIEAEPGSRTYGSLSVQIQARAAVSRLVSLAPGCFHPAPKVHSAVVGFEPRPIEFDPQQFDRVVRLGFSARRKTLHNTFTAALGRDGAREFLLACDVDPGARAETIPLPAWHRLAAAFPSVSG
ncbi:MAG: ribosomal RNA small subunit methyltransferase A [Deltaproteobacteria bacterium]|nr:ribosomal RNA small subunit methyltransferase A [Deltaproteobacteria bacterium]